MRFQDFRVTPTKKVVAESARVGREYQHLEDLVFIEGSKGALDAVSILENFESNQNDVAIKWDGNPTIYWGREPSGEFVLVGKNGWGKNKSTDPENLANFVKSSGKREPWREKFGNDLAEIFRVMESATPKDFRGYLYGDLLYHPGNPFTFKNNTIEFTPNLVTYTVNESSNLGKQISSAKVGIVAHMQYESFGDSVGQPITNVDISGNNVVVLGQTYITHTPKIDKQMLLNISKIVESNAKAIDEFLTPIQGLSDMKNIIYTYVNHMSKAKKLDNIETNFFEWLSTSKVSAPKQNRIVEHSKKHPAALPSIFKLVKLTMETKDKIIEQLDNAEFDVKASTNGQLGGEGYVLLNSKTKFVPRTRWQPN